jgi:hypothetical protein
MTECSVFRSASAWLISLRKKPSIRPPVNLSMLPCTVPCLNDRVLLLGEDVLTRMEGI